MNDVLVWSLAVALGLFFFGICIAASDERDEERPVLYDSHYFVNGQPLPMDPETHDPGCFCGFRPDDMPLD